MPPSSSEVSDPSHPLETFQPSSDYSYFEAKIIHPAIHSAQSRAELAEEFGQGSITFSQPRSSLEDTLQFLIDTDDNCPDHKLRLPRPLPTPKSSAAVPLTRTTSVVGYVSNKCPDCFVWQGGYFEEGSYVVLGKSFRKARVAGSYGLG
jgi:hypothetical protein